MTLPDGMQRDDQQLNTLIGLDESAHLKISAAGERYRLNERTFDKAIKPYLLGAWEDFHREYPIDAARVIHRGTKYEERSDIFYAGAEHSGNLKRPNVTVLPNWSTTPASDNHSRWTVLGCTMGHQHPGDPQQRRIQEVYEFHSYGMLLIDREDGQPELWVAQDGDKVAVPSACHMSLYNLGDERMPLVTLDFADPQQNESDKKLIAQYGPELLCYYDQHEVYFVLNRLYVNNAAHKAGVQLPAKTNTVEQRLIRIQRVGRLSLGSCLHRMLTRDTSVIAAFARIGIQICRASPQVTVEFAEPPQRMVIALPLNISARPGAGLYQYFFPGAARPALPQPQPGAMQRMLAEEKERKAKCIHLEVLNRSLQIVIEGAGDWVEQCYVPLVRGPEPGFSVARIPKPRELIQLLKNSGGAVTGTLRAGMPAQLRADIDASNEAAPLDPQLLARIVVELNKAIGLAPPVPATLTRFDIERAFYPNIVPALSTTFANDTSVRPDLKTPDWATPSQLAWGEQYLDRADAKQLQIYQQPRKIDAVFVVTPDDTHTAFASRWLSKTKLVFVEKPFASHPDQVAELIEAMWEDRSTSVLGLDHYQAYALPLYQQASQIIEHLGGGLEQVRFYMTEDWPIEKGREDTLKHGLTLDLLPHLLALLLAFGDISTLDDLRVIQAGQYKPLRAVNRKNPDDFVDISRKFQTETYARIRFTFADYSQSGYRIPCLAVVGKGLAQEVKFLEVTGINGNKIRVDFNKDKSEPSAAALKQKRVAGYAKDGLLFLLPEGQPVPANAQRIPVDDPYEPGRPLGRLVATDPQDGRFWYPLARKRYQQLIADLLNNTQDGIMATLLPDQAEEIVRQLDRIWTAIQAQKQDWIHYDLKSIHPVQSTDTQLSQS